MLYSDEWDSGFYDSEFLDSEPEADWTPEDESLAKIENKKDTPYDKSLSDMDEETAENIRKLRKTMLSLSNDDKAMLVMNARYNVMNDLASAMENMETTTYERWNNIIGRMNAINGLVTKDDKDFDFNALFNKLIPKVTSIATSMLTMKELNKMVSELSEEEFNKIKKENENIEQDLIKEKSKSVVLSMCDENENGFSH